MVDIRAASSARRRGRPTNEERDKRALIRSGNAYLSSTGSMYIEPIISADTLRDYSDNPYFAKILNNQLNLIFTEKYEVTVKKPNGKADPKLSLYMKNMLDSEGVRLWNKMKLDKKDKFTFGISLFNPVWENIEGSFDLVELRRLPPESFSKAPMGVLRTYCDLLPGIIFNETSEEIEYWQYDAIDGVTTQIKNIFAITDTDAPFVGGKPTCLPIVPLITMIKFAWNTQMQKCNRIGSPLLFLRITNPKGDDVAYGMKLLKMWGKDTAYILRDNMELIDPGIADTATALETIRALEQQIGDFFSPSTLIAKEGTMVSGSSAPEQELLQSYIRGIHSDIEDSWKPLLTRWLEYNGYVDYTVELHIPLPNNGLTALRIQQVDVGFTTQCMTINERRENLDLPPLDEAGISALQEEFTATAPAAPAKHGSDQTIGAPQKQIEGTSNPHRVTALPGQGVNPKKGLAELK